jgi:hypothetical protein
MSKIRVWVEKVGAYMSVDPNNDPEGIFPVNATAQQWAKHVGGCACGEDDCHPGVPCRNDKEDNKLCRFCPGSVGRATAATRLAEFQRRRDARQPRVPVGQEALL